VFELGIRERFDEAFSIAITSAEQALDLSTAGLR
jgi:hypothetical protein